jgi:hypothetical protein
LNLFGDKFLSRNGTAVLLQKSERYFTLSIIFGGGASLLVEMDEKRHSDANKHDDGNKEDSPILNPKIKEGGKRLFNK